MILRCYHKTPLVRCWYRTWVGLPTGSRFEFHSPCQPGGGRLQLRQHKLSILQLELPTVFARILVVLLPGLSRSTLCNKE